MTKKSITKKSERRYIHWIMLALAVLCFGSCKDDDDNKASGKPFDPAQPVQITDFLPKSGGMGQRLIIYGKNFGNDPNIVKVLIGGKEAKLIGVNDESIYCLVPRQAFKGNIEIHIENGENAVIAQADSLFDYQRKMVVSTVIGYRNERGDEPWVDGKFKDPDQNKMASGFWEPSWFKLDPANPKHLWMVFDFNNGLYLANFEDSTVTKIRSDLDRPRSIDFTLDKKYMIIAEDRGNENDRNTMRLSRESGFKDLVVMTQYRQCNTASVHPVNGELYFNSYEKGQFFRFDLNKYFSEGLGPKNYETLFFVHDPEWEYRIIIHPTGNYAYIMVVNKNYILRVDYNWEKEKFNQPYLVCGEMHKSGYADGVGINALLNSPYQGIFVKNPEYAGTTDEYDFYFTEQHNHDIRILSPEGSVTTFAGRGSSSINPDPWGYVDGDLREEARFDRPTGIAYNEEEGAFYIGDYANRRIRKIALEEIDEEQNQGENEE